MMIWELILVTVDAHWLLLLHVEQHPTGPPKSDVRCPRLPLRGYIAHSTNYPKFRHSTRALRSKVRIATCQHPDHPSLTSILAQGAQMPHIPLGRFCPIEHRGRACLEHWSRYHLFPGVVLSHGPLPQRKMDRHCAHQEHTCLPRHLVGFPLRQHSCTCPYRRCS